MLLQKFLDILLLAQYNIRIEIKKEARKADSVIKMKYATDYQERKLFGGRRANFDSLAPQPLSEGLAVNLIFSVDSTQTDEEPRSDQVKK